MNLIAYSEDQYDAIREISNIAMGRAADSLARLLDRFVRLPVPSVRLIESAHVAASIRQLVAGEPHVTVVRQAFSGRMRGEALVFFCGDSFGELAELFGHEPGGAADPDELVLELSNLLVGACIGDIAEQLGYDFSYSAPSIVAHRQSLPRLLDAKDVPWIHALLLTINFRLEDKLFVCHVLAFWPDDALRALRDAIDRFLEGV